MAYNENLVNRIREELSHLRHVEEKAMFGGICFMVNGKMCMGVTKDALMCRIDPAAEAEALERRGCRPMDFTGRPMKGYVFVDDEGYSTRRDLQHWIGLALDFNQRAKPSKKTKKKR